MFVPEKLVKVRVVCLKKAVEEVVKTFYEFGTIHISTPKAFIQSRPLDSFQQISEKLITLRAGEKELGLSAAGVDEKDVGLEEVEKQFNALSLGTLDKMLKEKRALEQRKEEITQRMAGLEPFKAFKSRPSTLHRHTERVGIACFSLKTPKLLENLKARFSYEYAEGHTLIAYDARDKRQVEEFIEKNHCVEARIPEVYETSSSFEEAYTLLQKSKANLSASLEAVQKNIEDYKKTNGRSMVEARIALELHAAKAELPARFTETENLALVEGWVPEAKYGDLGKKLSAIVGKRVFLEKIQSKEGSPTKLDNPKVMQPFEFLVQNLSLPKPDEIDPTFLVFLSFPLFFGMILGDIAYGIALVALSLLVRKKFKEGFFHAAGGIMLLSALWTIVFGIIFGEFLGAEHILEYELHPIIPRAEEHGLIILMQLCVLIGFIHVALGFVIGAVSAKIEGHTKHALAKISWLVVVTGLIGFIATASSVVLLGMITPVAAALPNQAYLYILLAGLAGLVAFEGANALFELPGLVSNIVSYLRIMAIGVSGVILASMINMIPLNFSPEPAALASFVLFAAAFTLGHAFALVLGAFESSIQSLRLHYVEFFSKFYHGGGIPFMPLKRRRGE